jgi:hypothetical protein
MYKYDGRIKECKDDPITDRSEAIKQKCITSLITAATARSLTLAFMILEQRSRIQYCAVRTSNKLMRQVGAVVEGQPAPPIGCVLRETGVAVSRLDEGIKTIVVACSTIHDIPGGGRVIKLLLVSSEVGSRGGTLVGVDVTRQDQVNIVFQEKRLKDVLAVEAIIGGVSSNGCVPGAMTSLNILSASILSSFRHRKVCIRTKKKVTVTYRR